MAQQWNFENQLTTVVFGMQATPFVYDGDFPSLTSFWSGEMLLTVEYNEQEESVEFYFDEDGLDLLLARLNILRKHTGHDHLMTPSWAGTELTEEKQGEGRLINHLRLTYKSKKT